MQFLLRILCFFMSILHFQFAVVAKVRGVPGIDYPNYTSIPKTSFKCPHKLDAPEFYADFETRCQVFHYCYEHRKESFLCPEGTTFNKAIKACDYWYSSECDQNQNTYEVASSKRKKSIYNHVPLVPAKVQTNNIFEKMASLYEPKKHIESSMHIDTEVVEHNEYPIELTETGNENQETDSFQGRETILKELKENQQVEENVPDLIKCDHDSEAGDVVDIIFYDSSINSSPHKNDNNEVDSNNIEFLGQTKLKRYQDTIEEKERKTFEKQSELLKSVSLEMMASLNLSELEPSENSLFKRLSDAPEASKKKRFRRKPTYVVLQTSQGLKESTAESTTYGKEDNQPIKNIVPSSDSASHISHTQEMAEVENKLKNNFEHLPVKKVRRNRKKFVILTDESGESSDKTESVEEYQTSEDALINETNSHQSLNTELPMLNLKHIENEPEDIKISTKKARPNRKTFGIFSDELNKGNTTNIELAKEYENINVHSSNKYNALHSESPTIDSTKSGNEFEEIKWANKRPGQNRETFEVFESVKADKNESTKPLYNSIMPANIMTPAFKTNEKPIFVHEHDTTVLTNESFMTTQPALPQAAMSITTTEPKSITEFEIIEKELEEKNDININFSPVSEPHLNVQRLRKADIDTETEPAATDTTESVNEFEYDTENKGFSFPKMNSGIGNEDYSERDQDNIINKNSYIEDNAYSEEEKNFENMEDRLHLEQDIYADDTVYLDSEIGSLAYSEQEMNPDMATQISNDDNRGIYSQFLSANEQEYEYDDHETFKIIADNKNDYSILSTLSPITIEYSSEKNDLPEDIMPASTYESPEYFEEEQMSDTKNEHIYYTDTISEMNLENEEKFTEDDLNSDIVIDFSNLNEVNEKNLDQEELNVINLDHEVKERNLDSEEEDKMNLDEVNEKNLDYIEENEMNVDNEVNTIDMDREKVSRVDFDYEEANEINLDHKEVNEISLDKEDNFIEKENSGTENSETKNLLDSFIVFDGTTKFTDGEPLVTIPEERFKNFTFINDSNDMLVAENVPIVKIPTDTIESFTPEDGLKQWNADKNLNAINTDEYMTSNGNSVEIESVPIYQSTNTKTTGSVLLETKGHDELVHSDHSNIALGQSEQDEFELNQTNKQKSYVSQTKFEEIPQIEEEKTIDSVFHSSSMPLPTNAFEQGLYKQSLKTEESDQTNRDKRYPSTFYKELGDSSEKVFADTPKSNKYRSLNFDFPFRETDSENVQYSRYREPSLISFLGSSPTVKRFFTHLPVLKSNGIFSPPVAKTSKPIKLKKIVAFGKSLLAFKKAKLNDFKLLFDSFMN